MKKEEQKKINEAAYKVFNAAMEELKEETPEALSRGASARQMKAAGAVQLNKCEAFVWPLSHFYVLQSYATFVAAIDKTTDTLVDVLRTEYGYTPTSARQISKFKHIYGGAAYGCNTEYIAR